MRLKVYLNLPIILAFLIAFSCKKKPDEPTVVNSPVLNDSGGLNLTDDQVRKFAGDLAILSTENNEKYIKFLDETRPDLTPAQRQQKVKELFIAKHAELAQIHGQTLTDLKALNPTQRSEIFTNALGDIPPLKKAMIDSFNVPGADRVSNEQFVNTLSNNAKTAAQDREFNIPREKADITKVLRDQGVKIPSEGGFDKILSNYFGELTDVEDRGRALGEYLKVERSAAESKKMVGLMKGGGPSLQKVMQLLGDKVPDPILKQQLDDMKEGLTELKQSELDFLREHIVVDSPDTHLKVAKAASVGQTVLIQDKDGKTVAVGKVKRFGIDEQFNREVQMIQRIVGDDSTIVNKVKEGIQGELDFENEVKNISLGETYQKLDSSGNVAKITGNPDIPGLKIRNEAKKNFFYMSVAEGASMVSIDESKPALFKARKDGALNLYSVFIKNALFGDGRFHADLHPGNIFVDPNGKVTPIDFGSVGKLEPKQQAAAIIFVQGIATKDEKQIANALQHMSSDSTSFDKTLVQNDLKTLIADLKPTEKLSEKVQSYIATKNLDIDKNFLLFIRADAFFDNQFKAFEKGIPDFKFSRTKFMMKEFKGPMAKRWWKGDFTPGKLSPRDAANFSGKAVIGVGAAAAFIGAATVLGLWMGGVIGNDEEDN